MKSFRTLFFAFLFLLQFSSVLVAQDEEEIPVSTGKKAWFGVNLGGILANKYTAPYYNGIGNGGYTVLDLLANPQIYNQIYNVYNQDFELGELPSNPKYRIGLAIGGNFGFYLDESTALYTNLDFIRLNVAEVMTIYTDNPSNPSGEPIIHPEGIIGQEQRFSIDLGLHFDYGMNQQFMGYVELAGNFNAVKAIKNEARFGTLSYNLLLPPTINPTNQVIRGGVGWGAVIGTGVRIKFNKSVSFDLGSSAYIQRINLFQDPKLKLNPSFYVRIIYS